MEIQINEGPQWLVNQMTIEGVSAEDEAYLRSIVRSTQGQPYSEANIASDRDAVLGYYYNNGYPDAQFESSQDPAAAPNQVNLRYRVVPGEQQFVRGTLVRGLETTKASLVASRISVAPGDPISQSRIAQSQQRLYDLGIFSKVETALQNPDGKEESKYVLFHLDEARKYSFNFGSARNWRVLGEAPTRSITRPEPRASVRGCR